MTTKAIIQSVLNGATPHELMYQHCLDHDLAWRFFELATRARQGLESRRGVKRKVRNALQLANQGGAL